MSGGGDSPRQKMINMMYLVYLALLAMNVSAEVLEAFGIMTENLKQSAEEANINSNMFIANMSDAIQEEIENQNKRTHEGLLNDTLPAIKASVDGMIAEYNKHLSALVDSISGTDPQTGDLLRKDEMERNLQYWMGRGKQQESNDGRGEGQAFRLRNKIDAYIDYMIGIYNSKARTPSGRVDPADYYVKDPENTLDGDRKSWERYIFEGPLAGNVAILQALKLDVFEIENMVLKRLNEDIGVASFKADSVISVNAPVSNIVPAGLEFETKLFVAMSSSQIQPTYRATSGGKIESKPGQSFAIMKIPASANVIPKGKNEGMQKYSAMIELIKTDGEVMQLPIKGEFMVRRPEIVVTSAAVQNLYRQCANDVNIDVPALGDNYNPRITGTNADVVGNKQSKKKWRIVPAGKTCVITVNSMINGRKVKIGDLNYKVINPPKPSIQMIVNGREYNGASMVPKASRIAVRLEPDAEFASALPQDARYGIAAIEVLAQLTLGPPERVNRINSANQDGTKPIKVSLGTKVRQARPGTKVYVRIEEVFRKNFQGRNIPDKRFSEIERTLSLVVK